MSVWVVSFCDGESCEIEALFDNEWAARDYEEQQYIAHAITQDERCDWFSVYGGDQRHPIGVCDMREQAEDLCDERATAAFEGRTEALLPRWSCDQYTVYSDADSAANAIRTSPHS